MTSHIEAMRILATLDDHANRVRRGTRAELDARADRFIDMIPTAPDDWALTWLRSELRAGRVPTLIAFPKAWKAETTRRLQPFRLNMPAAPDGLRGDGEGLAILWERAYLAAALAGADRDGAYVAACAKLGVPVPPPRPPSKRMSWAEYQAQQGADAKAARDTAACKAA